VAQTKWGIVYGVANPHDRQHILPDDDSELANYPVSSGEKLITIPIVSGEGNAAFTARMNAAICADAGVTQLVDCRFAEIDSGGNVIAIHRGDAALYPGLHTYVNCTTDIAVGHTYSAGVFTVHSYTLNAKPGVRATSVVVAAKLVPSGHSTTPIFTKP
jgi:hypothetical protein